MSNEGYIAVDLDGTLAHYDNWVEIDIIGEPIKPMVERVITWLAEGQKVKIFTARANPLDQEPGGAEKFGKALDKWCLKHIGQKLEVTYQKDYRMIQFWDDRAIQIVTNTGLTISEHVILMEQGVPLPIFPEKVIK